MSFDICLRDSNGDCVKVARHEDGGIYVLGGTDRAELNITYNYSPIVFKVLGYTFRNLKGKKAGEFIDDFKKAIEILGTKRTDDYWEASNGNVGACIARLLSWAREYPSAIFEVI